jgi:Ca2+-binding EF-hand superfamily protein
MTNLRALGASVAVLVLAGCGMLGGSQAPEHKPHKQDAPYHPAVNILTAFDANGDGIVTRAEMEAGLHAAFAKADVNHDGKLDEGEARAVNQQRLADDQSTASPLVDWNHDGYIDFNEFAANARSLFEEMDRDGDGQLDAKELHPEPPTHAAPPIRSHR